LIFDFDDSIFLNSSYNPRGRACPKRFTQFKQMAQAADFIIAGNEFLRAQAIALTDPARVRLIPTVVDVRRYALAAHAAARQQVKLAWIGSGSTLRGLEKIRALLERLGQAVPGLELKVICDRYIALSHLPVDFRRWTEPTEAMELADADIGISWLPSDDWSRGKCGLKILQYMSAGLPVVANPVGMQKTLVRHGETGFLVETPAEWQEAVAWLARDPDLRRQMGAAGRRRVEADYDLTRGTAAWQRLADELAPRGARIGLGEPRTS
jgi:glycosyltransferase involved in cell wall biosynthesis